MGKGENGSDNRPYWQALEEIYDVAQEPYRKPVITAFAICSFHAVAVIAIIVVIVWVVKGCV